MMEARASRYTTSTSSMAFLAERGVYRTAAMILVYTLVYIYIWSRLERWSMEPSYDLLCLSRLALLFVY